MSDSNPVPAGDHDGEQHETFFDDFSSGELDRAKWSVRTTGHVVNDEQQAYVDSEETIYVAPDGQDPDNQVLVLHPRWRPGHTTAEGRSFDFISGRMDTRGTFEYAHGYASARMKLPSGAGLWPAFWSMGDGDWPDIGEIDVMEFVGDPGWVSCGIHGPGYSGEAGLVNRLYFPDGGSATDWHVYTVERAPGEVTFKVDDQIVYRVTLPMVEFFGSWAFDGPKFLILNFALGGTYPFKTNGIRSPYYGIPEATVERIEADEVKVLIDWVRAVEAVPSASNV